MTWYADNVRTSRILPSSLLVFMAVLMAPIGCKQATAPVSAETRQVAAQTDEARERMELIPPPSKTRYMAVKSLNNWANPYVTIQGNMLTLHVLQADANSSGLGEGGLLRPTGARRQDLNIRVSDLPAALDAIPENAWPYGRVVAVEEAHNIPVNARPQVRRNMELAMQMLSDLGVVVYEWNEGGAGLR